MHKTVLSTGFVWLAAWDGYTATYTVELVQLRSNLNDEFVIQLRLIMRRTVAEATLQSTCWQSISSQNDGCLTSNLPPHFGVLRNMFKVICINPAYLYYYYYCKSFTYICFNSLIHYFYFF